MTDREAVMRQALAWINDQGKAVFARGGMNAVDRLNEVSKALTVAIAQPEQPAVSAARQCRGHLINLAAWLLSPDITRSIDDLEENTHIGHRQFQKAQEKMHEVLQIKAIEIRKLADQIAANAQPEQTAPAQAEQSQPVTKWEDPRVQTVYDLICADLEPPKSEHWDGFVSRRIVDALFDHSAPVRQPLTNRQLIYMLKDVVDSDDKTFIKFARAIEAKHGITTPEGKK